MTAVLPLQLNPRKFPVRNVIGHDPTGDLCGSVRDYRNRDILGRTDCTGSAGFFDRSGREMRRRAHKRRTRTQAPVRAAGGELSVKYEVVIGGRYRHLTHIGRGLAAVVSHSQKDVMRADWQIFCEGAAGADG